MTISENKIYPRMGDKEIVYLKNVITDPNIEVGDYTIYNDFVRNPCDFQKNNVLYHYPINGDKLIIGKFCSIACGAKFLFTSGNHSLKSLSTYTFPIFYEEWNLDKSDITTAWDNKGNIVIGNDVWIGYEAVILSGVKIGDGAVIGARAVVTKDVEPYTIVGGVPAKPIRKRFDDQTIAKLEEIKWWNWDKEQIEKSIKLIQLGQIDELLHRARSEKNMETQRLILRKWTESDAESLFEYAKDPDVGPIAGWQPHKSVEESLNVIRNVLCGKECYAICEKTNNIAIGSIELMLKEHNDMSERDDECELGYWLGKPFWGRGYMPEAVREMLRHGFEDLGMNAIWCAYFDGNQKSKRVQEKVGFVYHHTCKEVPVPLMNEVRVGHTNLMTKDHWLSLNAKK